MDTAFDQLRKRLAGPLPGAAAQRRMAPRFHGEPTRDLATQELRPAAAIALIYVHEGTWHLPLTVRGSQLKHHTGQVSLPGGRLDSGESVESAALREAHEEVGVSPSQVEILGRLTPISIDASGHLLHPVVGLTATRPDFRLAEQEVDRLIEVPVSRLFQPGLVKWEQRRRSRAPHVTMDVPYFDVEGAHVWGATAMVIAELLALLDGLAIP